MEIFQSLGVDEDLSSRKMDIAAEEIADEFIYLLLITHELCIDLIGATKKKILKDSKKYSADKAREIASKDKES